MVEEIFDKQKIILSSYVVYNLQSSEVKYQSKKDTMNNDTFKKAYLEHLKHIKILKCSYQTKIQLIQGLISKLRFMHNNPELMSLGSVQKSFICNTPSPKKSLFSKKQNPSENQSTSYSFYSDNQQITVSSQDYQQKIMQKRVIKFQINEEIQALEDDLFQIEKVVETKRVFNDELAKSITKRMKEIGQNSKTVKEDSFLSRTSSKLYRKEERVFDMNATVSGASGFGFSSKIKGLNGSQSLNISINSSLNTSISIHKNDMSLGQINEDQSQRKKAKSHIGKSITGIFKSILK